MKTITKLIALFALGLSSVAMADPKTVYMALWRGITEAEQGFMDYLNAQNEFDINFVIANAESNRETVATFADEIKSVGPDLVYTFGTTVSLSVAGKQATVNSEDNVTDTPVVFAIVADPVGADLVPEMGQPSGRNVTGASHLVPMATQLNAILELGSFAHIGVLYNATETNSQLQVANMRAAVADRGGDVLLSDYPIDGEQPPEETIAAAINQAQVDGVDVLYLPSDSFLIGNGEHIASASQALALPVFSATESPVQNGYALAGLVSKYYLVGQLAGFKALQILQGTDVAGMPVETLPRFQTVVNLDVADAVDYYPPVNLLLNATLFRQ